MHIVRISIIIFYSGGIPVSKAKDIKKDTKNKSDKSLKEKKQKKRDKKNK